MPMGPIINEKGGPGSGPRRGGATSTLPQGEAYEKRVLQLEREGLTTSDAQAVATGEFRRKKR